MQVGIRSLSSSDSCLRALSRWKPAAAPVSGGREIGKPGHDVRLIPPADAKPFVTRQKNDAADAEAICEAAMRPTMRFVPVKSEETRGAAMVFRVRELLIRQRTQAIDALRGQIRMGRVDGWETLDHPLDPAVLDAAARAASYRKLPGGAQREFPHTS